VIGLAFQVECPSQLAGSLSYIRDAIARIPPIFECLQSHPTAIVGNGQAYVTAGVAQVHCDVMGLGVLYDVAERLAGDLCQMRDLLGTHLPTAFPFHVQIHLQQGVESQVSDQVSQHLVQFGGLLRRPQIKDVAADVLDRLVEYAYSRTCRAW
jgi:hypothetical protein